MTFTRRMVSVVTGCAGLLAGTLGALPIPIASAQPTIPFVPTIPGPLPSTPGSYTYTYNNFASVASPATVDARGIKIAANADPAASADGLPGSKLGNSAHWANSLTSASERYLIQGGITPASPASTTGVQFAAGNENPAIEDPHGQPPPAAAPASSPAPAAASVPGAAEAAVPATIFPGAPTPPVLESADGKDASAAPASSSSSG